MPDNESDGASRESFDPGRILASWWQDLRVAAAFLTRLPLGPLAPQAPSERASEEIEAEGAAGESLGPDVDHGELAQATRAFPLVGLIVGVAGALVLGVAAGLGLPLILAALLGLATGIALTGALHEDGLADVVDGLAAGRDREAKLAIMHDANIGAFAVLALVLSVGVRAGALAAMGGTGAAAAALVAGAAGSRAVLPLVMDRMTPARLHGMAVSAGRPARDRVLACAALGAALMLLFLGPGAGLAAIVVGLAAAAGMAWIAQRQVGGYTGDILGAVQQVSEIGILLAAAATA